MKVFRSLTISLILLAFVLSSVVLAKPVNKTDAEKMVKGWLKTDPKPLNAKLGGQVVETAVFNGEDDSPAYYIVYLNPSGFVIVPADDLVEPVIGFVTGDAIYDPSPENPLGALVSRDVPGRIDAAKKGKVAAGDATKAQSKWDKLKKKDTEPILTMGLTGISDVRVAPLVQSKWGQDYVCSNYCYNYYTPNHYYCGCTATAMAQILRYMQYPTAGIGVHQFGSYSTRGGDGSGGAYNWGLMTLVPDCGTTEAQRQQIGALCYDAGVAAYMDYGASGSGAYIHDARAAFIYPFMYSNAIMGGNESTNIGAGLNGMVNPNLDAGVPVEFGIYGPGHAVVCDGYGYQSSTLYHHINLGWDGAEDAWYNLPTINTNYGTFTSVFACIYNLYTSGTGEIISGRVTYSSGAGFAGATVTATGTGGPYYATTNENGIYALVKVNSNTTYTVSVSYSGCSFTPSSQNAVTGTSTNTAITSGNVWGVNFSTTCTPPSPPPTPASISYPSTSDTGEYTVSWSSSTGAIYYQLERSSNGGESYSQVYSGESTSYSEDVGNGSYLYRVKATNAGGSSGWRTGTYDCIVALLEGYAPITTGGAGGTVVHVTNCNDSGQGSLRAVLGALTGSPTIVVFDVGGVICIGVEIGIVKPYVTIDGSTAPSPGITITSAGAYRGLSINTHDVIVKHIRVRDFPGECIQVFGDYNLVFDHVSLSWSGDGALDVNGGTTNIIISRCLYSGFVEGDRCYGINASLHHNMWTWGNRRQPKIYIAGPNYDFRNNVVEYWTGSGTNIVNSTAGVNIINNYYGNPAPTESCALGFNVVGSSNLYTAGNYSACGDTINETGDRETPVAEPSVTTLSAQNAYTNVLANVGAKPTDSIDQYYIDGGGTNPPGIASCGGSTSAPPPPPPIPPISEWIKGDIHYHTTNSDGSETLATMVTTYRDTGGHAFSCVADHDYISNANQYTTSSFLGVNGVEASGGPHVVGFGVNGSGGFSGGSTLQSAIDAIANAGGLPMVAHVRWSHDYASYDMATLLANMTNCNLMSVYNYYCEDLWGYGNSESYWDTLLTNNKTIYGYAEDDTHGLGRMGYTFNRVAVAAADANLVSIKSALANGNFYFGYSATKWGNGITVSSYTISGYDADDTISITTSGATNIKFIGDSGAVLQSTDSNSAVYEITGTEKYVRVKATNTAGDITWMQPVFIGGAPPPPPPPSVTVTYAAGDAAGWNLDDGTVICQTIYGTAQDSSGNITANSYRYLSINKGLAFTFGIGSETALDSITFKLRGVKASENMQIRMFDVSGEGYLDYGHTMSRSSPGTAGNKIFDITTTTPSTVPTHDEAGAAITEMTIGFDALEMAAGEYLICFDAQGPSNTWGNFVRGLTTEADGMGKWPDGTNLPARATVTTSSATGNNYYYQLDGTSATGYTPYSYQFAFQMRKAVDCNAVPWQATSPNPANSANNVNATGSVTLRWAAGPCAESHDVYFGTSYNGVLNADHNSPEYKGNQTSTSYDAGTLSYNTTYYWSIDEINGYGTTAGDVWSFTTGPEPPAAATSPSPSNSATNVSVTTDLSWTAGARTDSHDVYFGTGTSPAFQTNQAGTTFDPGTLAGSTTYYWRIDERNTGGVAQGTLWSFTTEVTAPGQASNPSPVSGASYVPIIADLSWTAGSQATSHDVYFGTSSPGDFQGNQTGTTFDLGTLAYSTTYYWRIDEKNSAGTTTGQVWSFTTIANLPAANYYVATNGNDNNSGTTPGAPFATIQKAANVMTAGQTVLVMPGTYTAATTTGNAGTSGNPITYRAYYEAGAVIIDGTGKNNPFIVNDAYIIVEGFEFKNANWNGLIISSDAADYCEVRNCIMHDNGTQGLKVDAGDNCTVENCLIYNNGDDGVEVATNASGTTFERCTIYGNNVDGIYFTNNGTSGTINNCIITCNKQWGIGTYYTVTANVAYSDVWGNISGSYKDLTKITVDSNNTISANPEFIDAADKNFYLDLSSPCIGTASDSGDMGFAYPVTGPAASAVNPSSGSTYVALNTDLRWAAGTDAVSHDVYFGTASPGSFQGNQTDTTFDPGTLNLNTTYYWRIDEVDDSNSVTTGAVWSFTTTNDAAMPAADYYVATNGSDNNSGTSPDHSFATIQKAADLMKPSQTVLIMPGTYNAVTTTGIAGVSGDPITYRGYHEAGAVIIDGTGIGNNPFTVNDAYIIVEGFEFKNAGYNGLLITGNTADYCEVRNCVMHDNGTQGLKLSGADDATIENCLIYNNGSDGVENVSTAAGTTFSQCTIYGNSGHGFYFSASSGITILDSIIVGNGTWGIYTYSTCAVDINYSDTWNNTSGSYSNLNKVTVGEQCISSDPLFVNPANGDFHLGTGSPCIGTASDSGNMGYRY